MALCVTKYFSFCFSLLLKEEQSLKAIPLEKHILLAEHNGYLSPRQCPSRLCATDSSRRERFVLNSQLANFARGGLWGSGEWSTGQKLGESIHNNCPGKLREARMCDKPFTHSLLARLGSEDVHVPFSSGSYFFSHPGPFTFFSVRMILEETFALLLVKQLVQPK